MHTGVCRHTWTTDTDHRRVTHCLTLSRATPGMPLHGALAARKSPGVENRVRPSSLADILREREQKGTTCLRSSCTTDPVFSTETPLISGPVGLAS